MKTLLPLLCLLLIGKAYTQKPLVFYVTSVCGVVQKGTHTIVVGDTLSSTTLVRFNSNARITLFNAEAGSFMLPGEKTQNSFGFTAEVCDLFKLKSSRISLSSRGNCDEATLDDCLKTDTSVNQKILLIDSLLLPIPVAGNNTNTKNTFFLQWVCNGKVVNKILGCYNGRICIKPSDLINDSINYTDDDGEICIGVTRISTDGKNYEKIGSFKICCATSAFISQYYSSLQQLMKDKNAKDIFSRLYTELYVFYGRPDLCALKNLVHYTD